ncbi:oligosaccharide flippase family protein [Natrinema pallidum]|uniref:Lipopolysaccharide biosynthesis protein n=1 Tax=Natrinema pallidum TaxID=69527 RepID=A0A4P9TEP7_9EURY|nr:oligosaccharide flippase family protein [Natrinema pallidum]QCW02595.1 lipopolysaccharide biosynthesis protein [Natrinema pallidum]
MGNSKEDINTIARFIQDFGFYTVAEFVPAALGLVALVFYTRVFDTAAYGQYSLTIVFVTVLSTGLFGWLEQAVLRFESTSEEIVPTAILTLCLISAIGIAIGTISFVLLGDHLGQYRIFYMAAVVATVSTGSFRVFKSIFQSQLKSKQVSIYSLIRAVLKLSVGISLSVFVFDSIVGWVWGAAIGSAVGVLSMFVRLNIYQVSFDKNTVRQLLWYGVPMIGWLFGLTLLTFADRILIEMLSSTSEVGIYSSNYMLVQTGLPLVLSPIIQTLHPIIMNEWDENSHKKAESLISEYSRYYIILGTCATIFAAIISRPLSTLVLGNSFHSGFVIIPIIALSLFFWNFSMIGHKGLELYEATGIMTCGVGFAVVTNIFLNFLLIPPYSYIGAAFATLLSSAVYVIFAYLMSWKTVRWTIPRETLVHVSVAGCGMAITGLFGYAIDMTLPLLVFDGIIGILVYFLTLFAFGEFRSGEVVWMRKVINTII